MANKAISELPQAQNVNNQDLFVLEQSGIAKKLPAETFITEQGIINALAEALDGHGGISSVTLASVSGRIRTYRITFTDQSATTFQVYDGTSIDRISRTSSSGLDDVYTIFLSDGTTTFFTVHNGADGTVSEAMLNDALKDKAPAITETTESSAIANFTDGADDMVMHNVVAEINPVQSGSGDPSPSNIRPITGWTGCNVTRTGKNLLPYGVGRTSAGITYTLNSDGTISASGTSTGTSFCDAGRFTLPSGSYILNGCPTNSNSITMDIRNTYGGAGIISGADSGNGLSFTLTEETTGVVNIRIPSGVTVNNLVFKPMIRLASDSDATYEPYITPSTVSLSWQTEAGTVYGGTIDVATGLLTVEYVKKTVTSFGGTWGAVSNGYGYYAVFSDTKHDVNSIDPDRMKSNIFKYNRDGRNLMPLYSYGGNSGGDTTQNFILPSTVTTLADANAWLADNPTECTFKLATPQTYQLTPQQLMTLYGNNSVWADVGNVSVTYPADTKMFIEKLTMPTEDDLVANQAITSGKYFMIGNSLYLALANIASGAQITIGTNAQRVSLADALNTINS